MHSLSFKLRDGDDVELTAFAAPAIVDVNSNGRPSLARVERIVGVGNTVWLHVRRLKYHAAVHAATTCSVVQLDDAAVAAEVLPVGVVAAAVLLTHACIGIVSTAAHAAAVAAAAAAGGAVELPCVWRAGNAVGRQFGRMRELEHSEKSRRVFFVNRFIR